MQIRFDGGSWSDIDWYFYSDIGQVGSELIDPPWTSTGNYSIEFRWMTVSNEWQNHQYDITVIQDMDHKYYGDGNRIQVWEGGSVFDRPMIICEGIDANNETFGTELYSIGEGLFNAVRNYEVDIAIFDFANGGADMTVNAAYLRSGLEFLTSIQEGEELSILAGVSMGGVVGRYALVVAENEGTALPVSHFLSLDAPQQGAVIDSELQDYMELHENEVDTWPIECMAARQLLQYNTFDESGTAHESFFNELNSYGNNGYPENCTNIGVAFSTTGTNPNTDDLWLRINYTWPISDEEYYVTDEWAVGGSFLPENIAQGFGRILGGLFSYEMERLSHPTFIPYTSALDIRDENSMFDFEIEATNFSFHDEIPEEVVIPILAGLGLLPGSTEMVSFRTVVGEQDLSGNMIVDGNIPITTPIEVPLAINETHSVRVAIAIIENPFDNDIDYQYHYWNNDNSNISLVNEFWGWQNSQTENFNSIETVSISSTHSIDLQLHDPWYIENPNAAPVSWVQPDAFRPLSDQDDGSGNVQVFLDQNENFYDNIPIYRLKAPNLYATTSAIYVFDEWTSNGMVDFGGGATTTTNRTTDVVFLSTAAEVTANYQQVNNLPGVLTVYEDEILRIPDNASIVLKSSDSYWDYHEYYAFDHYNEDWAVLDVWGQITLGNNAELKGDGSGRWGGIRINGSATVNINNSSFAPC